MKTHYFKTDHFVRRDGNVIDFTEYRNRMQRAKAVPAAVGDPVSYQWETDDSVWHGTEPQTKVVRSKKEQRSSWADKLLTLVETFRGYSLADKLEITAAAATLGLVLTIWVQFLL